jgi:hypothetical protein
MIDSLVIKKSTGTGITPMPDNGTKLYPDNMEKCNDGLCYLQWSDLAADLLPSVQKMIDSLVPVLLHLFRENHSSLNPPVRVLGEPAHLPT